MPESIAATKTSPASALRHLTLAKYLFRLRATSRIELSPYKGFALHGGLGHALKKISPFYFRALFAPGPDGTHPRPFVLLPPLDTDQVYLPGRRFSCELTLFGSGIQRFPAIHAALEYLGNELGLARNRGRFVVEAVEMAVPAGPGPFPNPASAVCGLDIAMSRQGLSVHRLTLHFSTPLRLKNDGCLVRRAPSFQQFLARLLGRFNTLATLYGNGRVADSALRAELLSRAEKIELVRDESQWLDMPRFSGRQKSWMKFGGLLGEVTYAGDLEPFIPFLALGEWTHTGGKTSFGLGKYVMASPAAS